MFALLPPGGATPAGKPSPAPWARCLLVKVFEQGAPVAPPPCSRAYTEKRWVVGVPRKNSRETRPLAELDGQGDT